MNPSSEDIRQHGTHSPLIQQTGPKYVPFPELALDAIVVPASRPAVHLDHAVTLARAAECWLLVLCSQRLGGAEVRQFLTKRSFAKAIVIDLPRGYSHRLLSFPALQSLKDDLPPACGSYVTDLSMKRNMSLVLARMLGWRRIFFLDDDIRDVTYPNMQSTVNMLKSFSAVGMWVTDFPDNSIVCHANRMSEGSQDVFVSGAALAVDCNADLGFFPDIYNEDWLFFFDDASAGRLANSHLKATQLCYYPFANTRRAAWQEFGDVLAEGLYALLHQGLGIQQATRDYWAHFLEARRIFLEEIITRSRNAHPDIRTEMVASVESALKCLLKIKPDQCERYIRLWRQDLTDWRRRMAGISKMPSIEAALQEMRLLSGAWISNTGRVPRRQDEAGQNLTTGPATIPRSDAPRVDSAASVGEERITKPSPVLTPEYSEAMLAAKANADGASYGRDGYRRRWRQRFGVSITKLGDVWDTVPLRRTFFGPPPDPRSVFSGEPVDPEPEMTATAG